jgi:hypothetical protein
LFSALFFSVFGNDRMLYAAVWTPYTVLVIAAGWETWLRDRVKLSAVFASLLCVLVVAQTVHHLNFLDKIIALVNS